MIWLLTFRSWFTQPIQVSVTRKLKGGFFFFYLKNTFSLSLDCTNNLFRHTGLNKSISGSLVANNLLWFMHRFLSRQNCIAFSTFTWTLNTDQWLWTRSAEEGAATPLHCALAPSLANTTGVLIKRLQKEEIEAFASDQVSSDMSLVSSLPCLQMGIWMFFRLWWRRWIQWASIGLGCLRSKEAELNLGINNNKSLETNNNNKTKGLDTNNSNCLDTNNR